MNDGIHAYTYDAENRIVKVDSGATAVYGYDAEGRRVSKTAGSSQFEYLFDLGGRAVTELIAGTYTDNRTEAYAGGRHLATENFGSTFFVHTDWLGTDRARTTLAGSLLETCTGLPYGDALVCTGFDVSPLHFTGMMRDAETGLDDFPARYYSSGQGRWYSPDWASAQVPVPYADLHNPQSLNLYDYVGSDPTNHADADGHFWLDRILGFGDAEKKEKDSQGTADATTAGNTSSCGFWCKVGQALGFVETDAEKKAAAGQRDWINRNATTQKDGKPPDTSHMSDRQVTNYYNMIMMGLMMGRIPIAGSSGPGAPNYQTDPAQSPGAGWEWRGKGPVGRELVQCGYK